MALIDNGHILWAAHSERYSRIKNDCNLNADMVTEMRMYGEPKEIIWFENPYSKALRKFYSGQQPYYESAAAELRKIGLHNLPLHYMPHHKSHAAAGFHTSNFDSAIVLVIDAIGEWDTTSIWQAKNNKIKNCVYRQRYPNSIGLFYSAVTQWAGLKPNEEEYILMGMAAYGEPKLKNEIKDYFFSEWKPPHFKLRHNLHRGCKWWQPGYNKYDVAASAQAIVEEYILQTLAWVREKYSYKNLVFMGGVALNCVANSLIARSNIFDDVWIMPNPGDSGSAIGAVAAYTNQKLYWQTPYLGTNIAASLNVEAIVKELLAGNIVGVANGRAEFGPRALGNRSLLCDPRRSDAKQLMNNIKHRQQFRPFAPAVLSEHASTYFDMPQSTSPYMQYVAKCKDPDYLPGICHVDNTSRVQTVSSTDNVMFRSILEAWYNITKCPVLMNTSLNIRGEPLVNTWQDAEQFQKIHNIKIF